MIGAGGIGREVALGLAAHGATVTAADLDEAAARHDCRASAVGEWITVDVTDTGPR